MRRGPFVQNGATSPARKKARMNSLLNHKPGPNRSFSAMADDAAANRDVPFPGVQDFQLLSSDGYTFRLSRQILIQASGFFADMFTIGSSDPGSDPVTATEEYTMLDPVLRLAYAQYGVSAPSISSFTTLTKLYRIAEKYEMHAVLQCLLSVLFQPQAINGYHVFPFIKTHPIPSLALLMLNGSQLGVQAAMQECIVADKGMAAEIDFGGIQIDVRMVLYIHSERQKRIQFIMSRIETWSTCGWTGSKDGCLQAPWNMSLRRVVEGNPTLSALSRHLLENRTCAACGRDTTSINQFHINTLLTELQGIEQFAIPLPSVSHLLRGHTVSVY